MIAICLATACMISCLNEGFDGGIPKDKLCLCYTEIEQEDLFGKKLKNLKTIKKDSVNESY